MQHLLAVACGLESMVVGESQILGQVRQALSVAREQGTLSRGLGELGTLALRTAKRAHAETRIDQAGANLVSIGIAVAHGRLTAAARPGGAGRPDRGPSRPLAGLRVLVVGAGSMSSLAATTAARMGAAHIVVANRTADRAERLAASVGGAVADLADLAGRARPGRPGHLLHRRGRRGDQARSWSPRRWRAGASPAGRWSCWTWPCPATSIRPWPGCPGPAGRPGHAGGPARRAAASRNWPAWPPVTRMLTRSGRSWPRSSRPACRPCTRPGSRPPWSRCGPRRPRWWTPSWPGWPASCPPTTARWTRWNGPCGGWWTSCCTRRRCGSRNWPGPRAATPTRTRCGCCSISTPPSSPRSRWPTPIPAPPALKPDSASGPARTQEDT